jgi:anti-sigma B factor antagonist
MGIRIAEEFLAVGGVEELTAANQELFRKQIYIALNGHTTIEIDLSRTTFMDCAGLGALIALRIRALGRKGVMRLVNPTPLVRQLFDVVRAEGIFEIVDTRPTVHPLALRPFENSQAAATAICPGGTLESTAS